MGAVYKGSQPDIERAVAIKILPAEIAADEGFVARFKREAQTLAKLQHPGIVSIYESGRTNEGHLYFVMEYVDGLDLEKILRGPRLQPAQALEAICQICEALNYAHQAGVIHRDIKPANILFTKSGRAKLADFGLARPVISNIGGLTKSNMVVGTFNYMAPEQHQGQGDQRADIYALGVMLYEMLTGQRPQGIFAPPSQRVAVDVRIDDVVVKALQQEPALRYQRVSEMHTDVDRIRSTPVEGTPKAAPNVPTLRRRTLAVAAVFLSALLVVGGFALSKKRQLSENYSAPSPPVPPTPPPITPADRINYFFALWKWHICDQESHFSGAADKKEMLGFARSEIKEMRETLFDQAELPVEFRQAFLRLIACADESIALLDQMPDVTKPGEVASFVARGAWNYLFKSGAPEKELKARSEHLQTETSEAMRNLDKIGTQFGARTDWDAMPRVAEVLPDGLAAKLGVQPGDFLFTYDGTKLFRRLHFDLVDKAKSEGKAKVEAQFLTRKGVIATSVDPRTLLGVRIDNVCNQIPALVRLIPFPISRGYYVIVVNGSQNQPLSGVSIHYTDGSGHSSDQFVGTLSATEAKQIDPDDIKWRVATGQTITVKANGLSGRDFLTSKMIK
jgi:serine/threonine protein kinase